MASQQRQHVPERTGHDELRWRRLDPGFTGHGHVLRRVRTRVCVEFDRNPPCPRRRAESRGNGHVPSLSEQHREQCRPRRLAQRHAPVRPDPRLRHRGRRRFDDGLALVHLRRPDERGALVRPDVPRERRDGTGDDPDEGPCLRLRRRRRDAEDAALGAGLGPRRHAEQTALPRSRRGRIGPATGPGEALGREREPIQ